MELPLDYATLKVLWWGLVGVLLIGYALTDGYDLGVASLLPFVAKNDKERRLVINSIGPMWEGHQVWLITGGGALFAAWPYVYAISFSGFYLAMFTLPSATPKIRAGTKPPTNSAQSQDVRHVALSRLDRYLNPTGLRISAASTTNMAR